MHQNEQKKIKVSVILPVWNPGPGISRCIESIRNQTLSDIEMIFVDDLGTDDSMDRVHAAAKDDPRIRIVKNEKNMGPGFSRNKGIEVARGEYLSFVDPDDYVALDFLELLYSDAHEKQADIAKGCSLLVKEDGSIVSKRSTANIGIRNKLAKGTPLYCAFTRGHQNAIYRRDLIISKNIRYGMARRFEDVLFLMEACFSTKLFLTNDDAHYYYCERSASFMNTVGQESLNYYFEGIYELQERCEKILPKNMYTAEYLRDIFLSAIRELYRYNEMGTADAIITKHLNGFHDAFSNSSYCKTLTQSSFTLREWYENKKLLPIEPFYTAWDGNNPPVQYAKLVEHWVDFYLAMPKEAEECWKELRKIITKASKAVNGKPQTRYSIEEQKEGKALLNKQIKRLPLRHRIQLEASETKKKVKSIVKKFCLNQS